MRGRKLLAAVGAACAATVAIGPASVGMTVDAPRDDEHAFVVALLQVGEFDPDRLDLNADGDYLDDGENGPLPLTDWASVFCTGTVIEPRLVLTAGHCLEYAQPEVVGKGGFVAVTNATDLPVPVFGGWFAYDDLSSEHRAAAGALHLNPAYKNGGYRNDVAALTLTSSLEGADTQSGLPLLPPANLLSAKGGDGFSGAIVTLVGYGTEAKVAPTKDGGSFAYSNQRRQAAVQIVTIDSTRIHERQTASVGACYGDSGGPTLMDVGGTPTVIAVTSTGDGPCWSTNVASRVDRPAALDFLAAIPRQ